MAAATWIMVCRGPDTANTSDGWEFCEECSSEGEALLEIPQNLGGKYDEALVYNASGPRTAGTVVSKDMTVSEFGSVLICASDRARRAARGVAA